MLIKDQNFYIDTVEVVLLNGNYEVVTMENKAPWYDLMRNDDLNGKAVFRRGVVLKNFHVPDINELVQLLIRYTHDKCDDVELDFSVKYEEELRGAPKRQTREDCFQYKGRLFSLYGPYIYGYDKYVSIQNVRKDRYEERFLLPALSVKERAENELLEELSYAMRIVNIDTDVLEAFGLYS